MYVNFVSKSSIQIKTQLKCYFRKDSVMIQWASSCYCLTLLILGSLFNPLYNVYSSGTQGKARQSQSVSQWMHAGCVHALHVS